MIAWLSANLVNIALILFLALLVFLILFVRRRARLAGKPPCGCSCGCEACGACGCCGSFDRSPKAKS